MTDPARGRPELPWRAGRDGRRTQQTRAPTTDLSPPAPPPEGLPPARPLPERPASGPARRCPRDAARPLHTTGRSPSSECRRDSISPGPCRGRAYTPAVRGTPLPDSRCRLPRSPRGDETSVPCMRSPPGRRAAASRREWAAVILITAGAAILRLLHIGQVTDDPFYDAAVRSMGLSFHNFFFGAFEPSGSVSIDKPPVDLWLQVASVKLLGFSSTTLKLPEALAGIAAVPLLWAAVRRMWSVPAALAAATALAVLPVEVITSRSDTMDGVMMALIVLALLFVVLACQSARSGWLFAAAAMLGLAFDVKLLESLVALPGLAVLAYLGLPGARNRRLMQVAAAGAIYVVVALAWLTATLLV